MVKTNTNALRKAITQILSAEGYPAFYQNLFQKEDEYIVYDLSAFSQDDGSLRYQMEVNCISRTSDAVVEDMADSVQDALKDEIYSNEKLLYHADFVDRKPIFEEDKKICRRRLVFNLYHYSKEEK